MNIKSTDKGTQKKFLKYAQQRQLDDAITDWIKNDEPTFKDLATAVKSFSGILQFEVTATNIRFILKQTSIPTSDLITTGSTVQQAQKRLSNRVRELEVTVEDHERCICAINEKLRTMEMLK